MAGTNAWQPPTMQTKYDIGAKFFDVISMYMTQSAVLGVESDTNIRAINRWISVLRRWNASLAAIVDDDEYEKIKTELDTIKDNWLRRKKWSDVAKVIEQLGEIEVSIYKLMRKYKMLTKFERNLTAKDRMKSNMNLG